MIGTVGNGGHNFEQAYICGGVKWINAIKNTSAIEINVRKYRKDNQKWTIQRNWHHRAPRKAKKIKRKNTTQYV